VTNLEYIPVNLCPVTSRSGVGSALNGCQATKQHEPYLNFRNLYGREHPLAYDTTERKDIIYKITFEITLFFCLL
jgi:hypothetical protein